MRTELDFDAATQSYKQFLAEQSLSTDILWIFREDVTVKKRQICICWPLPSENPGLAEQLYEQGRDKGSGLRLDTFCLVDNRPCCYVWVPRDEVDADHAMLSELKMSVPTEPIHAKRIRSKVLWQVITWLNSRSKVWGFEEEIPKRS
jgi:hypothetical protein